MMQGAKYRILIDNEGFKYSGKKTRVITADYINEFAVCLGLIAKSNASYAMGCVFLAVTKYKCPIKIFRDRASAQGWVDTF